MKRMLSGFGLLVLGLCACSDFGDDVKYFLTVKVEPYRGGPILVEISSIGVTLTNNTQSTVYYDSYPAGCDACGHGVCLSPDTCPQIDPTGTAWLEYREGGTIIRWWHLVPNVLGTGFTFDEVRYIEIP